MPLLTRYGGASARAMGMLMPGNGILRVQDVFNETLYTANGAGSRALNFGMDLTAKNALCMIKARNDPVGSNNYPWCWQDTKNGTSIVLYPGQSATTSGASAFISAFTSTGVTLGNNVFVNDATYLNDYVIDTFIEHAKFLKIVPYTGNGATQALPHGLGAVPGMVIIKSLFSRHWRVWHRGFTSGNWVYFDQANPQSTSSAINVFGDNSATVDPDFTNFTVGNNADVNALAENYVAYVLGHDTSANGLIVCDSFTTDGSSNATVTLPWEPYLMMVRARSQSDAWSVFSQGRGWAAGNDAQLTVTTFGPEITTDDFGAPTSTGFTFKGIYANNVHTFTAVRKGPM